MATNQELLAQARQTAALGQAGAQEAALDPTLVGGEQATAATITGTPEQEQQVDATNQIDVGADLAAAQGTATTVQDPAQLQAPTMDPALVGQAAQVTAAQGDAAQRDLEQQELITGQLDEILAGIDNGEVPAFARPAVNAVEQMLQRRGLSTSSVGRAELTRALISSAIPLAAQNAQALQRRSEVNLTNEQQMRMQNLGNEQQAAMANAQFEQQQLLTDAAAQNAARQFNATSEGQTQQFVESLKTNVRLNNAARIDAMEQFNVNSETAMAQFNKQVKFNTEQFNAQNATAIQQSNLQWRRQLATQNTANQQQANLLNAQNAFKRKSDALAFSWQQARDIADHQWKSIENNLDRALNYETAIKTAEISAEAGIERARIAALSQTDAARVAANAQIEAEETAAAGALIGSIVTGVSNNWDTIFS